jgi:hypothetical protein
MGLPPLEEGEEEEGEGLLPEIKSMLDATKDEVCVCGCDCVCFPYVCVRVCVCFLSVSVCVCVFRMCLCVRVRGYACGSGLLTGPTP